MIEWTTDHNLHTAMDHAPGLDDSLACQICNGDLALWAPRAACRRSAQG